jgi:hypothetical protein
VSALNTHTPIDFCLARCCRGAIAAIGPSAVVAATGNAGDRLLRRRKAGRSPTFEAA